MALTLLIGVSHVWVRFSCNSQRRISSTVCASFGVTRWMASIAATSVGIL